jgi:hypothetical protein
MLNQRILVIKLSFSFVNLLILLPNLFRQLH